MMRSGKPLISLLTTSLGLGGAEMVQLALGRELLARGYRVDFVFGWDRGTARGMLPPASRSVCLEQRRLRDFVKPLAAYLRRERPDAMMASMWPLTCWAVVANKLAGSPSRLAVCDHNSLSLQYRNRGALHRFAMGASIAASYPFADARIVVSDCVARDIAGLSGLPVDRFSVVNNPLSAHLA